MEGITRGRKLAELDESLPSQSFIKLIGKLSRESGSPWY